MSSIDAQNRITDSLSPHVKVALDHWQADLLDLTKANHLLYFKPGSHGLAFTQPSPDLLFAGLANGAHTYTFYRPVEEGDTLDLSE